MQRAALIARREFVEHLRTRGFWFSLATVPLIMLLALAIPLAAQLTRPGLAFAVTDHSGFALQAVVRHADRADLQRLLEDDRATAQAPAVQELEAWWAEQRPEESLGTRLDRLLDAPATGAEEAFLSWWRGLDRAEMTRLDPRAWRARFQLVHDPARWVAPAEARMNLAQDRVFAWIEIPEDPVGRPGAAPDAVRYTARNLTNRDLRDWFEGELDAVIMRQRRQEGAVPERIWNWISAGARIEVSTLDTDGATQRASARDLLMQWGPVAFVYVLWISIQIVTQMLLSSTVEEKSNRLIELLLASAGPLEIMAGKIVGIASVGGVIVGAWLLTFALIALGLPALLGSSALPDLGALVTNPVYLASFALYYVLGYLFYAALLCGVGSLCDTLREAQTLAIPVQSLLFVPLLAMVPIARDPSGTLAGILTWIPPFTPFVMMNRAAQAPGLEVYAGTTALMIVAIAIALMLGARLFRAGVLMTGQSPGVLQILRLLCDPGMSQGAPVAAAERR